MAETGTPPLAHRRPRLADLIAECDRLLDAYIATECELAEVRERYADLDAQLGEIEDQIAALQAGEERTAP